MCRFSGRRHPVEGRTGRSDGKPVKSVRFGLRIRRGYAAMITQDGVTPRQQQRRW
jgi:hypothetical protein